MVVVEDLWIPLDGAGLFVPRAEYLGRLWVAARAALSHWVPEIFRY